MKIVSSIKINVCDDASVLARGIVFSSCATIEFIFNLNIKRNLKIMEFLKKSLFFENN